MKLSKLHKFCRHVKSISSRKEKRALVDSLPDEAQRFLGGDFAADNLGIETLQFIQCWPEKDMELNEVIAILNRAAKVSGRLEKQKILMEIELDPDFRQFVIEAINKTLALGISIQPSKPILGLPFYPQLAKQVKFDPTKMIIEEKYDGIRVIAHRLEDEVILFSRNCKRITSEAVEAQIWKLNPGTIIDGEIVGKSSNDMQSLDRHSNETEYVAFDCLMVDGKYIYDQPLHVRRSMIPESLNLSKQWSFADWDSMIAWLKEQPIEGLMAKDPNASYTVNKREWFKLKLFQEMTAKVVGFNYGQGRRKDTVGSIIIEALDIDQSNPDAKKIARTNVGTGFDDSDLAIMYKRLQADVPTYVDIKYQNLTADKCLRFPVFLRIRDDLISSA